VYKHDITRFAQFANKVFGVEYDFWNPEYTALEGIIRLERFLEGIEMPVRLTQALPGIENHIAAMTSKAVERGPLGQFVKLGSKEVEQIYRIAL